jgi:hypothetical protein
MKCVYIQDAQPCFREALPGMEYCQQCATPGHMASMIRRQALEIQTLRNAVILGASLDTVNAVLAAMEES